MAEYPGELRAAKRIRLARSRIQAVNKRIREIHADKRMTPNKKREEIDDLLLEKNRIERHAVEKAEAIMKKVKSL